MEGWRVSLALLGCEAELRSCALRASSQAFHAACAAADAGSRSIDREALRRTHAEPPAALPRPPRPSAGTPAPPRQQRRGQGPTPEQRRLTDDIRACTSVDTLLDLVSSRRAVLSGVNVTAVFTRLQRLAGRESAWLQDDARFAQLMSVAESLFETMDPRGLASIWYACGQCGITPRADWLMRYWDATLAKLSDFNHHDLSDLLFACRRRFLTPPDFWLERYWHASASQLTKYNPQGLSITIHACGVLSLSPPGFWLERYWPASASQLTQFHPQGLSNMLHACANLDARPPANWLQSFSFAFQHALPEANQQNTANTSLAMAMFALWELPMWRALWESLCRSLSSHIAGWNADDCNNARQMYQVYQLAAVERPGLLPAPSAELLAAARKTWFDFVRLRVDKSSKLHEDVSDCLARMGVAHANERWCDRAERDIDIVVEGASPVALEVDGPYHYLQDGRPNGRTLLRNRILTAHGWRVMAVDYRVWRACETQPQQEEYLRGLLA